MRTQIINLAILIMDKKVNNESISIIHYNKNNGKQYLRLALFDEQKRIFPSCIHYDKLQLELSGLNHNYDGYTPQIDIFKIEFQLASSYTDQDKIFILASILDALICQFQNGYVNQGYLVENFIIIDKFLVKLTEKEEEKFENQGGNDYFNQKVSQLVQLLQIIKTQASQLGVIELSPNEEVFDLNDDDNESKKKQLCHQALAKCIYIKHQIIKHILKNRDTLKYILQKLSDTHLELVYVSILSGLEIHLNSEKIISMVAQKVCYKCQQVGEKFVISCKANQQETEAMVIIDYAAIFEKIKESFEKL
ncbi:UNKNOWN [Stylonychia lemnae]|uniref:Uncharacterized protein n=1 Tax=Stylonychia lemnae TaxID=5949 RepID=A0A078AX53_STYLE|nr:UNKNOWN [Stylonychia lemnae]|eukprot:CDW87025.1 UNKNOWN [Stylonychia lemnae]